MTTKLSLFPGSVDFPLIIGKAWEAYGDARAIQSVREISATVSTNHVYLVVLDGGRELVAKTSSYGSYVHFRQDHRIIKQWINRLSGTRYRDFLANILTKDGEVFTFRDGAEWVVFYEKTHFYDFLPKVLSPPLIRALGQEMASFHLASSAVAHHLTPSWKSLGSDVASLYDALGSADWREERGFSGEVEVMLRRECDRFLTNAERLGYHDFQKIPLLVDWNIGNFSIGLEEDGFRFFSRWDYDWFRVEPRALDFYFCARVVRSEGDQTVFSYTADPYFEEPFTWFLKAYHSVYPLHDEELLFTKEAYRLFLLNYVIRSGEHFFRESYCRRLQQEAIEKYFPALEAVSFMPLLSALR